MKDSTSFDERRVELARRISRNENVSLAEAFRRVPNTKPELDALVKRLNSRHGGPGSPDERDAVERLSEEQRGQIRAMLSGE